MTITNARTAAPSSGDRAGKRRRYRGIDQLGGLDPGAVGRERAADDTVGTHVLGMPKSF